MRQKRRCRPGAFPLASQHSRPLLSSCDSLLAPTVPLPSRPLDHLHPSPLSSLLHPIISPLLPTLLSISAALLFLCLVIRASPLSSPPRNSTSAAPPLLYLFSTPHYPTLHSLLSLLRHFHRHPTTHLILRARLDLLHVHSSGIPLPFFLPRQYPPLSPLLLSSLSLPVSSSIPHHKPFSLPTYPIRCCLVESASRSLWWPQPAERRGGTPNRLTLKSKP